MNANLGSKDGAEEEARVCKFYCFAAGCVPVWSGVATANEAAVSV